MLLPTPEEIARIVVCEDDRPTLELLCDHLTADRFGVLAAPTASDAMRLCIYDDPDLLLLDLSLPDASGPRTPPGDPQPGPQRQPGRPRAWRDHRQRKRHRT